MIIKGVDFVFQCEIIRIECKENQVLHCVTNGKIVSRKQDVYMVVARGVKTTATLYKFTDEHYAQARLDAIMGQANMDSIYLPLTSEDLSNNDL